MLSILYDEQIQKQEPSNISRIYAHEIATPQYWALFWTIHFEKGMSKVNSKNYKGCQIAGLLLYPERIFGL